MRQAGMDDALIAQVVREGATVMPGMFVQLRFAQPGRARTLLVPTDAVIHTGRRSVVMLAEAEGRFSPVDVTTGREAQGQTEVLAGLAAGQRVVLSAQFLIDSEASLSGVQARLNPAPAAAVATHRTAARIQAIVGDTVTLDHPPIPALKWPQMVMDFQLPPAGQRPRGLAAGDQVAVEFHLQDGDLPQITSLQRRAPGAAK